LIIPDGLKSLFSSSIFKITLEPHHGKIRQNGALLLLNQKRPSFQILLHLIPQEVLEGGGAFRCALWAAVSLAFQPSKSRDLACIAMAKMKASPPLNSSEMNLSTASAAFNDAANDGTPPTSTPCFIHRLVFVKANTQSANSPSSIQKTMRKMASLTPSFIVRIKPILRLAVESIYPCVFAER
jgi:hypothetical protein